MSWEIVTQTEAANFARVQENQLDNVWYDIALGMIEAHTGWESLTQATNVSEYLDGNGSSILKTRLPLNSVSLVQVVGTTVPSTYYNVAWYGLEMRSYVPGDTFQTYMLLERLLAYENIFPIGIKNVYAVYNYGGTASLPSKYYNATKSALLQIIKELSTVPRTEGSDSMLKKYRPDRTMQPEEVLRSYGVHGKVYGILLATLPKVKMWI